MSSIPLHMLHVYQRPKQGNGFIRRVPALHYSHQIVSNGWFDTASCEVSLPRIQAEQAFENWIGCRVAAYVDNPAQPIWEGLITRISYTAGGVTFTRSMDSMFNEVRGLYRANATSVDLTTTASQVDVDSVAVYGYKHGTFDGYYEQNTAANTATRMNAVRNAILGMVGWPQTSTILGGEGQSLRLEMKGFYHTLKWEQYYDEVGGFATITQFITAVLNGLLNGTTFFNRADLTQVQSNVTFGNISLWDNSAQPAWDALQKIAGAGDGNNFWIMGITPTDMVTQTRRFYYRNINTATEYLAYIRDNMRVRNQWGGLVRPWTVVPDRVVRVNDVLVGWGGMGDDPRETYIERINYTADTQQVRWTGGDDLNLEGTMQKLKYFKIRGTDFGPAPQSTWN